MAEDLQESLTNYKLQLQQVEAALTTDPSNADLNKLKVDLQEVINLTVDLIKNQAGAVATAVVAAATSTDDNETSTATHSWNVGDKCSAVYSEDGMYYDAVIDEVLEDGSCTVTFESYGNTDLTQVSLLKPRDSSLKRAAGEEAEGSGGKMKSCQHRECVKLTPGGSLSWVLGEVRTRRAHGGEVLITDQNWWDFFPP
ncbi:survival of motor neuron-related-splicing factor 30-like isoform X2 [Lingula anatina]|uniref:Survival of motor neuron-related-splicing factor 30-like isoform X2 n=1 Tax=Lingula anatina TaxID=7574 RepID=A0A1S3IQI7_LINAN|nr:survival of motor neuron-related-splicing factor 30-like isoform X2 [Lingula anatina]|eukprot:XP_013400333.1 survival of motor neuron-related-splicing factor 30-like isoform X2 [Lingula anatina]